MNAEAWLEFELTKTSQSNTLAMTALRIVTWNLITQCKLFVLRIFNWNYSGLQIIIIISCGYIEPYNYKENITYFD